MAHVVFIAEHASEVKGLALGQNSWETFQCVNLPAGL